MVQYQSLSWDINGSQHQHLQNGHSCEPSTHHDCIPQYMTPYQCNEHCQAILDPFLARSKPPSSLRSLHRSPTDDRQQHCLYHPKNHHRQCPSRKKDEIFRLFLSCCLLYLPVWPSLSKLQQKDWPQLSSLTKSLKLRCTADVVKHFLYVGKTSTYKNSKIELKQLNQSMARNGYFFQKRMIYVMKRFYAHFLKQSKFLPKLLNILAFYSWKR